jgi:hypothetical protein
VTTAETGLAGWAGRRGGNLARATFDPERYAKFSRVIVNISRREVRKILSTGKPV